MIIEVDESFKKDFKAIKNKELEKRIIDKLDIIEKAFSINEISNIKKLKGFTNFYRIRIGDYRIGLSLEGTKIVLIRLRSRKDIYNVFP